MAPMPTRTQSRTNMAADSARQTAAETLNAAILRLAVRRQRPLDPRQRAEMNSLVNQALQAYREYMRLGAAA